MTISESTETFFNKTVTAFDPALPVDLSGDKVYRLALEYDDERKMPDLLDQFLQSADKSKLDALVFGMWGEPYEESADDVIAALVAHAPELPALRALFIGDMTFEECEISWIVQGDYTPLLKAFPKLEELRIRGAQDLALEPVTHTALRKLTIESGGLPSEVVEALIGSSLPALEHLEVWLGSEDYGFDGDVELYRRLLGALAGPSLRYLGLRDSEISDELAEWLAGEEIVGRLHTLDLSLGTLGDEGARALLDSPHVRALRRLDLSHHYISPEVQENLKALPLEVVLDDAQEDDDGDRYVAVGE
ncbi:Leucine Rich repeat-containing protein [Duganella sp. CF458]|uniref:STM4015 family protein n=1 Tax=Duganella sp. CF458 TaxID=1884368 RepID=UPI0008E8A0FB|nr:STM4015 family protein [Duganella sp. CF458]SFG64435.1 Leucine Rich repeat-containing protein [Duganella sp. CF458]